MQKPNFQSPYASTLTRTGKPLGNPPNGKAATLRKLGAAEAQARRERHRRKALKHADNVALRSQLQAQKAAFPSKAAELQLQIDATSSYRFV